MVFNSWLASFWPSSFKFAPARPRESLIKCHPRAGGDPEVFECPGFPLSRERQWRVDQRLPSSDANASWMLALPEGNRNFVRSRKSAVPGLIPAEL